MYSYALGGSRRFWWAACVLVVLTSSRLAFASSLGFGASVVGGCGGYDIADGAPISNTCYSAGGDGDTVAAGSGEFGPGFTGGPNSSFASLLTGSLSAGAAWSTQNYTTNGGNLSAGVGTSAGAVLYDTVTFTSGAGTTAQMTLDTFLSASSNGGLGAEANVSVVGGTTNSQAGESFGQNFITGATTITDDNGNSLTGWESPLTVSFTIQTGVEYRITAIVGASITEPGLFTQYYPGSGVVSVDPNWALIVGDGVSYTTASGIQIGGDTPEPGTLALLGVGLISLGCCRQLRVRLFRIQL